MTNATTNTNDHDAIVAVVQHYIVGALLPDNAPHRTLPVRVSAKKGSGLTTGQNLPLVYGCYEALPL